MKVTNAGSSIAKVVHRRLVQASPFDPPRRARCSNYHASAKSQPDTTAIASQLVHSLILAISLFIAYAAYGGSRLIKIRLIRRTGEDVKRISILIGVAPVEHCKRQARLAS